MNDALKTQLEAAIGAYREGDLARARPGLLAVLRAQPGHLQALRMLGMIALRNGRPQRALELLERATQAHPSSAVAHFEAGLALERLGKREEAMQRFAQAVRLNPKLLQAQVQLSTALVQQGKYAEALAVTTKAIEACPASSALLNNHGAALIHLGRAGEAVGFVEQALELDPGNFGALKNRGAALQMLGRDAEAILECDRALALRPEDAGPHLNKSVVLLRRGELAEGFAEYEWRWKTKGSGMTPNRHARLPLWSGESLAGKRILLHAEQGLGDSIQFLRYAPLVAAQAAATVVQLPRPLIALAKQSLESGMDGNSGLRIVGGLKGSESSGRFDLQCPLMSLALAFGTTLETIASIPAQPPYLRADDARVAHWRTRLPRGRKIGFVWSGSKAHHNDSNRSIGLQRLLPLLHKGGRGGRGGRYVSLQRDASGEDQACLLDCANVMDLGNQLEDFADSAALVENLDLVITVDTAVAHLAGALGKPVFVLLPFVADWRWLMERSDSPWYPTARLFRQPAPGDWDSVVAQVREALAQQTSDDRGTWKNAG